MSMFLLHDFLFEHVFADGRRSTQLRFDMDNPLFLLVSGGVAENEIHILQCLLSDEHSSSIPKLFLAIGYEPFLESLEYRKT
jgi:hypothetical protein